MKDIRRVMDMKNSPKLKSMPTLCRSATLLAETTISKWRVTTTIRQLLQLPTGGTSAFVHRIENRYEGQNYLKTLCIMIDVSK